MQYNKDLHRKEVTFKEYETSEFRVSFKCSVYFEHVIIYDGTYAKTDRDKDRVDIVSLTKDQLKQILATMEELE